MYVYVYACVCVLVGMLDQDGDGSVSYTEFTHAVHAGHMDALLNSLAHNFVQEGVLTCLRV